MIRTPASKTAIDENPAYATKHDYINLDVKPLSGVHIICDLKRLPIQEESADHVLARHVLEHFGHVETVEVLREWCRVLRKQGTLEVIVPNLVREWRWKIDDESDVYELVVKSLYGGQRDPYDYHRNAFNWQYLRHVLKQAGFEEVHRVTNGFPYSLENPLDLKVIAKKGEMIFEFRSL